MRLFVSKTEAEWLLAAVNAARAENNFNMKGMMGNMALGDLALSLAKQIKSETQEKK